MQRTYLAHQKLINHFELCRLKHPSLIHHRSVLPRPLQVEMGDKISLLPFGVTLKLTDNVQKAHAGDET